MNLYTEQYHINPIPFDPADDRIQFYCSFFSHWLPGFVGRSAGGVHAVYSLVLRGKYHVQYPDCRYTVPDYWDIGEVYERLIEDVCGDDEGRVIECLMEVYTSWIDAAISDYNTDFYYQSRDYIYACYKEGKVLA